MMMSENITGVCFFCKKKIMKEEMISLKENETIICANCDFNRKVNSLALIIKILDLIESNKFEEAKGLLSQLDRLEIRESEDYGEEDVDEIIKTLKQDFFLLLFELNSLFVWRFRK